MDKYIVIPDSFKGTMSSKEVCSVMEAVIHRHDPACRVVTVPIADGGEGTVECFVHALKAEKVFAEVTGPFVGEKISACYARSGAMAIIETASTAGLSLVEGRKNPMETTTFGLGELVRHAVEHGCTEIVVGLGGSCTNDCGCGMAAALGVRFLGRDGKTFIPTGGNLQAIADLDIAPAADFLNNCRITAMCDIDNPLYGPNGAAYVFAPQKGADTVAVEQLDLNLQAIARLITKKIQKDVQETPGAGAAGGLGAGIIAFLGGSLRSGIDMVLDIIRFEDLLECATMVVTGEGRIDSQSLRGKAVAGIAKRAKKKNIPVLAVVGAVGEGAEQVYELGVNAVFSINQEAIDFKYAKNKSVYNLEKTMDNLMRLFHTARQLPWN